MRALFSKASAIIMTSSEATIIMTSSEATIIMTSSEAIGVRVQYAAVGQHGRRDRWVAATRTVLPYFGVAAHGTTTVARGCLPGGCHQQLLLIHARALHPVLLWPPARNALPQRHGTVGEQ